MSGAPATVSAGPPGPTVAIAPSNAVEQAPDGAGDQGSFQSFNEVLSAQRAESGRDRGERHDADGKKGPSHAAKEVQGTPGSPQSASADDLPAGSPLPPGISDVTAAISAAAGGAPGSSNQASDAGTSLTNAGGDAAPGPPAPLSALAASTASNASAASAASTASDAAGSTATETAASDGDVPAVITEAVSGPGSGAHADEPPGVESAEGSSAASTADGTAATTTAATTTAATTTALATGLADLKPSAPTAATAAASHGGASTEPGAGHGAPAPAVANVAGSIPVAGPLPHLVSAGPLTASDTSRAVAVPRLGESAAASTESAAPGSSSLDLEGLSGSISRPLSDGNGTYTVTVALHPPELGHLQAVVSLDGNDLQVSLTAQTQTGHDALANATEALKNQLARGGVNVNVSLRDPGSQAGGEQRYRPPTTSGTGSFITEGSAAEAAPIPSGLGAGQIHLVL